MSRIDPGGNDDLASLSIGSSIGNTLNSITAIQGNAVINQGIDGGNAGVNGLLFPSAVGAAFFAFAAVVGSGGKLLSYAKASTGGSVALDTNVLVALEGGEVQAVDAALAGRTPVISITAAKEFFQKGSVDVL